MKIYVRHRITGHIGSHRPGYNSIQDNVNSIGVYWICNRQLKNVYSNKSTPWMSFWNDVANIKIYSKRLPRKLKKKIKKYL